MTTTLIPVVFKRNRLKAGAKFFGGVLNPNRAFYVYRTEGNHNPMARCEKMKRNILARQPT